jgi:hypothetical protein
MKVDGACHCGAIAYEAEIDPDRVRLCHCTDCQELTGAAFRFTAPAREADFRLLRGEPVEYLKTGSSGRGSSQFFCGSCGSSLYTMPTGEGPKTVGIRAGTIRQRRELTPRREFWRRSALTWVQPIECAELFDAD